MVDLTDSGKRRLETSIIAGTLVILAVAIRFWCKLSLKSPVNSEDWWILAAIPVYLGAVADDIWGLYRGISGENQEQIIATLLQNPSPELILALETYLKTLWIGFILSLFWLTFIRISICLLYRRIFANRSFRIRSTVMIGLSVVWFIVALIVGFLTCIPLDKFWNPIKPGKCLNFNLFYLIIGVFETVIDIAILILPVRAIFNIQLPLKTKLVVSSIFLLGGVAVITNVVRLYKVYQPGQQSASYTDGILWTHIHGLIAVFCANIPVYRPLMTKVTSFFAAILSLGSSFRSSSDDTRERTGDSTEYFQSNFDSKPMAPGPSFNKQKHPDNVSGDGRYSVPTNSGGITSVSANGGDKRLDPLTCYELTVPTVADQA
ncbi:hypothetical protein F5Y08DRAFT_338818 [Xylaria arbuscula]|nr:hypothetical protein F5Y08DRAFT_338818 [Xylaria arbuscula]